MPSESNKIEDISIPNDIFIRWQKTVDLMVESLGVPVGFIVQINPEKEIEVIVRSRNPEKVSPQGRGTDLYSRVVIETCRELLVPNASRWNGSPDSELDLISYLGLPLTWPGGQVFGAICVLDDRENHYRPLQRRLLDQFRDSVELCLQTLNDRQVLLRNKEEMARLQLDMDRAHEGVEKQVRVRTEELNRANEALRESEARFRTMVDHAPEAMLVLDMDTMAIIDTNHKAEILLGLSREGLLKAGPASVSPLQQPDGRLSSEAALMQVAKAATEGVNIFEWVHCSASGKETLCEVRLVRLPAAGRNFFRASIVDVTEQKKAEQALMQSEKKYRTIFDNISEGLAFVDIDGRFLEVNAAYCQMLGYSKEEMSGLSVPEILHPDYRHVYDKFLSAIQKSEPFKGELVHMHKSGRLIYAEVQGRAFRFKGMDCLLGAIRDITERKHSELALIKSENQFRSIFENSAMGVVLLDLEGKFVKCNRAFCTLIGYPESELISMRFKDFTYPEDILISLREFNELLDGEREYYQYEKRYITKEGGVIWVRLTVSRIGVEEGASDFILAMVEDVTDRKNAERALLQSEERYRTIFNNISDGLSVHDFEGRFLEVNPADCAMHGYSKEELMALAVPEMVHPDCCNVFEEYMESIERTGFYHGEVTQFRKDGSLINVELKGTTIKLENKRYLLAIVRDITERKRTEAELRKYRERLEELVEERTIELANSKERAEAANHAKSLFLANMSHELRTPLNAILGFSQLMQRDASLADSPRKKLETINRSGEHLLELINNVLEVSKIEAGHISLNRATFDFYGLVEDIGAMFGMRAESKGVHFSVEGADELPRYLVSDEGKLRQVLINLLGNALKFTDEGSIRLCVSLAEGRRLLLFEVADTGVGIAPDEMEKLFQPFEQTLSGRIKGGTGLGLPISREYAYLLGGDLIARSERGRGSLFSFSCRFEEGREEAVERVAEDRRVVALAPDTEARTVLVVDDRKESRRFLAELLTLVGFRTWEAVNGEEALALFETEGPDLVLMDMRMPVLDGYEAIRRLKATIAGRKTPVIAVSASALVESRDKILETGADEYICKPFRESELFEAIGRLLGIEYLYEEKNSSSPNSGEALKLTPGDLEKLPEDLREELKRALLALNVGAIRGAIESITAHSSPLGEAMARLEEEYQFEMLLDLVNNQGFGGETGDVRSDPC